jgi:nitronate monooxygenase
MLSGCRHPRLDDMIATRFTKLVGCTVPVQLAAMGGVGTTDLAAAVTSAGGLGMVPAGTQPAAGLCGVNFLMPFNPSIDDIAAAASQCRVVEFFYADPRSDVVSAVHGAGALAGWQVGSAAEAVAAETAGCDYVVAQGTEAGGHVRGSLPLDDVLAQVLASVRIPVVAAGGIATAERTTEVIRSGADAVRVGTRFVTSPESGAHPIYVRMLLAATADDTVLTEWFNEGWPNAPHRVLRASVIAAEKSGWKAVWPPYRDVDRYPGDMAMYAGMGVGAVEVSRPASEVVADLVRLL